MATPLRVAPTPGPAGHPERDSDCVRAVGPRTSAEHLLLTLGRSWGVPFRAMPVVLRVVLVRGPFPDAPTHGVETIAVGREASHGLDRALQKPVEIAVLTGGRPIAPGIAARDQPAPGRLLPFRLRRKTVLDFRS